LDEVRSRSSRGHVDFKSRCCGLVDVWCSLVEIFLSSSHFL
jgi:hypothetical protein